MAAALVPPSDVLFAFGGGPGLLEWERLLPGEEAWTEGALEVPPTARLRRGDGSMLLQGGEKLLLFG